MRFSKELLYHFSCEKCYNSWSYHVTIGRDENFSTWYCPHCSHEHLPPHIDKDDAPSIVSEDFLEIVRAGL